MADSIQISGNVAGSVVIGDNNLVVNTNHGTIVYQQAALQVQKRALVPAPPRAPRGFVNRSAELARLESWISAHEIILLHAPDGLGKTALLKQAANSAAARAMPDGVILLESVDASGQALGPEDVIQRLFDALFESNPPLKVNATSARTYLSNTRPLVLFDEVPLTPALQNALPDLLPQGALILAADLPTGGDFERLAIKSLPRAEALSLLSDRAAITVNDAIRPTLDALCALLDDAPLALTITGNVLRETTDSPDAALSFLQSTPDSSPDRLRCALDRGFAYAFSRLSADEQKVLSAAALTPSTSNSPDWLSYALGGVPVTAALERLQALGLLYANSPRLRLPPGFRAPARREAEKRLEEKSLLAKLAEYLLANQSQPGFVAAELGNFAGALRASSGQTALSLARAIDPYLTLNGLWDLWGRALDSALEAAQLLGDRSAKAWSLHQMGTRLLGLGDKARASLLLRQAIQVREAIGDAAGAAYSRHNLNRLKPVPIAKPATFKPLAGLFAIFATLAATLTVLAGGLVTQLIPALAPAEDTVTATPSARPTETLLPSITPTFTITPTPTPDLLPPRLEKLYAEPTESYYGESVERCKRESTTTLFAYADDPSRISQMMVIYWYQFSDEFVDERIPRYEAEMKAGDNAQYSLLLDHNEQNRAENVLKGQDGWMFWQVIASDNAGNQSTQNGPPVALFQARCDTSAPRILRAYTSPGAGTYGDFISCGAGVYSSYMELHVTLLEESAIQSVVVQYYYRSKSQNGPVFSLKLIPYKGDPAHYYNYLDHNSNSQAAKTLKTSNGQFIWQITAIDEHGNTIQSQPYTIDMRYEYCPAPG
ncbi:MAG: ATP-binding protein [Anaerolineae bacterium]|nr:ATP-binding protein [Anaerolineae bacterium]